VWKAYAAHQQSEIEGAYQSNGAVTTIHMGNWTYEVDTNVLVQTNVQHAARKQRPIRRQPQVPESNSYSSPVAAATTSAKWTEPDGKSPDGKMGFLVATTGGISRFKDGYIFGRGSKGLGYYHQTTRDAYTILGQRLDVRAQALEQSIACDQCCGGKSSKSKLNELNELKDMQELVKARRQASIPVGDGYIPAGLKAEMRSKNTYDTFYSHTGVWYFPQACYDLGGGKYKFCRGLD
jgi:hypothetical protein